jgi:hypothetical protein
MKNCTEQTVSKLKLAQKYIERAIAILQKDSLSLSIIEQSKKAQVLLEEANGLLAKDHSENCIADLIRKGIMDEAEIEIKRLSKYNLLKI